MNIPSTRIGLRLAPLALLLAFQAHAATIVAVGASNTYGRGVARSEAFPEQLQAMLRARGYDATVVNAGENGETTGEMLGRLDSTVSNGTSVVILQPGGNDRRRGAGYERAGNIAAIKRRLAARGIKVIMVENYMFRGLPHQPDGMHLTPAGYHMLAASLLPRVSAALGRGGRKH